MDLDDYPPIRSMSEAELFRAYGETVDPPSRRPPTVADVAGRIVRVAGECSRAVSRTECRGELRSYRIGSGVFRLCDSCAGILDGMGALLRAVDSPAGELVP